MLQLFAMYEVALAMIVIYDGHDFWNQMRSYISFINQSILISFYAPEIEDQGYIILYCLSS